ncbi:MAG: hypothetical protein WCJ84_01525 [Candidatus Peregrinibacteria bacterium]
MMVRLSDSAVSFLQKSSLPQKEKDKIHDFLKEMRNGQKEFSNIKSLSGVPNGYRKRIGRYRILFTLHAEEDICKVWIIDMEKDTQKDYRKWIAYILDRL